jgi:hypothetical protein
LEVMAELYESAHVLSRRIFAMLAVSSKRPEIRGFGEMLPAGPGMLPP